MPWLELPGGYKFTFEAISPTTGNAITGVTVEDIAIFGEDLNLAAAIEILTETELETLLMPSPL